ncbi:MAG: hypothetical protein IT545_01845 [Rhodobacteraceae bacterium]|nr:hypothetical protein [Paracoccaceae bacterium]
MSRYRLTESRLRAGRWEGVLTGPEERPELAVTLRDRDLGAPDLEARGPGRWALALAIPADCLADGVHTLLLREAAGGEKLASLAIMAGAPLEDDVRAELDLLRAELDLLKRAFRRHVAEGR